MHAPGFAVQHIREGKGGGGHAHAVTDARVRVDAIAIVLLICPPSAIRPVLPSALCSRALFSLPSLPSLCFCASMACPTSYTIPLPPPSATTQRVPARSHAHAHEAFERRTPFVPFCFSRVLLALRLWAFIAFRGTPRTGFVRGGRREDRLSAREAPCAPLCSDRLGAFAVPAFRLVSRALVVCVRVLQR